MVNVCRKGSAPIWYMVNYVSAGGFNSMVVVTFGRLSTFMCKGSYIKNICL